MNDSTPMLKHRLSQAIVIEAMKEFFNNDWYNGLREAKEMDDNDFIFTCLLEIRNMDNARTFDDVCLIFRDYVGQQFHSSRDFFEALIEYFVRQTEDTDVKTILMLHAMNKMRLSIREGYRDAIEFSNDEEQIQEFLSEIKKVDEAEGYNDVANLFIHYISDSRIRKEDCVASTLYTIIEK